MLTKSEIQKFPVIVVGAGLFGLTIAERVASDLGIPVLIIEKRNHIGGNAFSEFDSKTGIEVHKYGTHIFHTSNKNVWDYVNRFTSFSSYTHKVQTIHKGHKYPMPINLTTINSFLGQNLNPEEARLWIKDTSSEIKHSPSNLEEKAISLVGRPLYEAFIKGYTEKQWATDPKRLPPSIITRLPVRFNDNDNYFDDTYQGLPIDGYKNLFQGMIDNNLIFISLNTDFFDLRHFILDSQFVFYSGAIDRFFDYSHGVLGWRTSEFEFEYVDKRNYQDNSVINFADKEYPYTRIHEFRHLYPHRHQSELKSIIAKESSRKANENDDPHYPINTEVDRAMMMKYKSAAEKESGIYFGGRLGSYKYLDMHMAIGQALAVYSNFKFRFRNF